MTDGASDLVQVEGPQKTKKKYYLLIHGHSPCWLTKSKGPLIEEDTLFSRYVVVESCVNEVDL